MTPIVSVIMPVHNGVPYLAEAIRSILDQSFGDFELVIVDDGSTDESPEIAASFADRRVVVLRNERQLGITRALNRGIAAAHGRLVARMDADDVAAGFRNSADTYPRWPPPNSCTSHHIRPAAR